MTAWKQDQIWHRRSDQRQSKKFHKQHADNPLTTHWQQHDLCDIFPNHRSGLNTCLSHRIYTHSWCTRVNGWNCTVPFLASIILNGKNVIDSCHSVWNLCTSCCNKYCLQIFHFIWDTWRKMYKVTKAGGLQWLLELQDYRQDHFYMWEIGLC